LLDSQRADAAIEKGMTPLASSRGKFKRNWLSASFCNKIINIRKISENIRTLAWPYQDLAACSDYYLNR